MANLTRHRDPLYKIFTLKTLPMKSSTTLYAGALVNINPDGWIVKAADTANHRCAGVAIEDKKSGSSDGDTEIQVRTEGEFEFTAASMTQANLGDKVYVDDDQTVQLDAGANNNVLVGVISEFISATKVRVVLTPWSN